MTAPAAGYVLLPTDTSNTGKKIQTQSETIGSDIVHAHYFIARSRRKVLARYHFAMALQSVQASAQDGTSTGFFWLHNPIGSSVHGRLKRLQVVFSMTGEADMLSVPRIALARITFTGTASGAMVTPGKAQSALATNATDMRTAVTGLTVTVGGLVWAAVVPTLGVTTSGISWNAGPVCTFEPNEEEDYLHYDAGEGFLLYQPDAGTASDTRRFSVTGTWDEYDDA